MLMNPDEPSEAEREVGIFTAVADKSCRRVSCQMHTPAGTYGKDMLIESVGNSILESPHGRHACTPIVPNVNSMQRMTDAFPPGDPRSPNGLRTSSTLAKEIRGRTLVQQSTGQRRTSKGRAGFWDMMRDVEIS